MGTEEYFLVIDLGTGSGRAAVFDQDGTEVGFNASEWRHLSDPRYPGSSDFDTERNWPILCHCIQGALLTSGVSPEHIAAVSVTGIRLGTVFYDKNGKVLLACTNTDTRADAQIAELLNRGLGPRIYEIDGEWPGIGGPSALLLWLREKDPEAFGRTAHVTMLTDWVLYKLTGTYSVDPSCAGTSGMFDGRRRQWSSEIAGLLGIPFDILAPVQEAGTVIGDITARAAEETGLRKGMPVVQGGSDAACGLAGVAVVDPGQAYVGTGSFWNASIISGEMIIDKDARAKTLPHVVPGCWQLEGVCFYAGYMLRWFRDAFCPDIKSSAADLGVDSYGLLDEQAAKIPPGAFGVQVSVAGVIDSKRWIVPPPTFIGWSMDRPEESDRAVFYRALMENAAFQILGTFELLSDLTGGSVVEVPVCGGAARSRLWPQILADVLGIPVKVPRVTESPALGAAMCAAVGKGLYRDLRESGQAMVSWQLNYLPTTVGSVRACYREKYLRWRDIYLSLLRMVDDGVVQPMWKAAGVRLGPGRDMVDGD